jgi:hypothetical protein
MSDHQPSRKEVAGDALVDIRYWIDDIVGQRTVSIDIQSLITNLIQIAQDPRFSLECRSYYELVAKWTSAVIRLVDDPSISEDEIVHLAQESDCNKQFGAASWIRLRTIQLLVFRNSYEKAAKLSSDIVRDALTVMPAISGGIICDLWRVIVNPAIRPLLDDETIAGAIELAGHSPRPEIANELIG